MKKNKCGRMKMKEEVIRWKWNFVRDDYKSDVYNEFWKKLTLKQMEPKVQVLFGFGL